MLKYLYKSFFSNKRKDCTLTYHKIGNIILEEYRVNGKLHRDSSEGAAVIWYNPNEEIECKEYWFNGIRHNPDGPSYIRYDTNNVIRHVVFSVNGQFHNPYGPAFIHYKHNVFEWWFNGIEYTKNINEYLDKQGLIWQNMDHTDFDIMWTIIL